MELKTMKNCGRMSIEFSNIDTEGARVSRDFLRLLVNNIVKRSFKYYDETGDHAFYYREKQFHSIVCPSIADITHAYLMEHPLKRKAAGEEEASGYADYWISYRNYSFLMELKHSYFSYRNAEHPRQSITRKFNDALEQLKKVRKEECRGLAQYTKDLIKIAFETIVFYEGSKNKITRDALRNENFMESFEQLVENSDLAKTSNMRALWVLNERLVVPYEYDNGSFEAYPAVAFVGKISEGQTK